MTAKSMNAKAQNSKVFLCCFVSCDKNLLSFVARSLTRNLQYQAIFSLFEGRGGGGDICFAGAFIYFTDC